MRCAYRCDGGWVYPKGDGRDEAASPCPLCRPEQYVILTDERATRPQQMRRLRARSRRGPGAA